MPGNTRPKDSALLPSEFASSGFAASAAGAVPARFQVLGERSSGTNLVKRLLGRNSPMTPTEALGWKHGPPMAMAIPPDLAVICVVRRAEEWALSMHAKPWHTVPEMQLMTFSQFIRAPWDTIIDRPRYFEGAERQNIVGQPLQADRNPESGARYENIFALRRAKLAGLTTYLTRHATWVLLRMENVQANPEAMTDRVIAGLGLPQRTAPFRGVAKRLGSRFKPAVAERPSTPARMSARDQEFMLAELDLRQESALGYTYG